MVKKTLVVTGGNGFIGNTTIDVARKMGFEVRSFDKSKGFDILGDLSSLEGADTVIHLAGILGTSELFDQPEHAVDVNIKGSLRILNWCRENRASFVGITMLPVFPSVYTATKVCAQNLSSAWHQAYGVEVSHVRAFNAYGPGQAHGPGHPQKIVPTFARAAWEGKPIPIWGDGSQTVDLIHANDIAKILVHATEYGDDDLFEAGTGVAVTVNEFADFVLHHTNSKAGVEYLPMRKGEQTTEVVATGIGWEKLGWTPELDWSLLGETIDWYKDV